MSGAQQKSRKGQQHRQQLRRGVPQRGVNAGGALQAGATACRACTAAAAAAAPAALLAKVDASLQTLLGGRAPPRPDLAVELPVALQLLELPGARQVATVPPGQLAAAAGGADEDEGEDESVQLEQEQL